MDDEPNILAGFQRNLRKQFQLDIAVGGTDGLRSIQENGPYAVVVADMQMPLMNGVEFLTRVQALAPDTVRMMLTGDAGQKTAMDAVNQGHVFRFLTKPCPPETLALALTAGLKQHHLMIAERELLENTLSGAVRMLGELLSTVEPRSFGQGQQLAAEARRLGALLKYPNPWELEIAATLGGIGFVTVPPATLTKAQLKETLTGAETDTLTRVPEIGARLLGHIPRLEAVAAIVHYQDKHYDGSGFPADARAGDDVPLGARILHVLSAMLRAEAGGLSRMIALEHMRQRPGFFDPRVLDAAFTCYAPETTAAPVACRAINLHELRIGHLLAAGVETFQGVLLVSAGNRVTPGLMEKLRNFALLEGIKEPIYVSEETEG